MGEQKKNLVVLASILILACAMGIIGGNYLITAMFVGTVLGAVFIINEKDSYNVLYAILLVSAIFDYTLYVPKVESVYMFHIMLGIFALVSLYKIFKNRDILMKLNRKILAIYVIWFVYMCISLAWASSKSLGIKYIAIYIMMFTFIVCMMIYNINKDRFQNTIRLILYLVSIIVVIGCIEVLLGKQLPVKHYIDGFASLPQWQINTIQARPIVFSFNTNNLDALLALLVPVCLFGIYKFENIIAKIWFAFVSCASFALIVITTSRTGYVAFLFAFVVFLIYSAVNVKKLGVKQMIYPVVLIIGMILAYNYSPLLMKIKPVEGETTVQHTATLSGKLQSLSESVTQEEVTEGSTLNRMAIISDVINGVVKDKRFQGFGVGNVEQFLREQDNTSNIFSPHCYPIEILGDFGIPGVSLFGIYYVYLLLGNLIKSWKRQNLFGISIVAGLIAFAPAGFGPSSITYVFGYWILMGLAASNLQVENK